MNARRKWVVATGERYWRTHSHAIAALPMPDLTTKPPTHRLVAVDLPDWARDVGVKGHILVDAATITQGEGAAWQRCDWIACAFHYLNCALERSVQKRRGPIHSYSFRLGQHDPRLFDYAWTNRIFLLLRRWAARIRSTSEDSIFGALPTAEIRLTHDVDAVRKTPELRLKQSAFGMFNAARTLTQGDVRRCAKQLTSAVHFATRSADFNTFACIRALEERNGLRSLFHVYGGPSGWRRRFPKQVLLDPAYDTRTLAAELKTLHAGGWSIGLHQSFDAWHDASAMRIERTNVESTTGLTLNACRQHWLRFALDTTWRAQQDAGFLADSTLGFNDRPGFRNATALTFHPWDETTSAPMAIAVTPMVLMDSHLYDYRPMSANERTDSLSRWLAEIRAVHGQATVNWHTHTITDAYGWGDGYRALLSML